MTIEKTVGNYGYRVTVWRHTNGRLYLRWYENGKQCRKALKHGDRVLAIRQAKDWSAALMGQKTAQHERVTVGKAFAEYERIETPGKSEPGGDQRRSVIWASHLGGDTLLSAIDTRSIKRFITLRREGRLRVVYPDGRALNLKASPTERTIGADIVYLNTVLNWAKHQRHPNGERWLRDNPLDGLEIPKTPKPNRPLTNYDRYLKTLAECDAADPQRLLKPFLMLVEPLGWRLSAIRQLKASDLTTRRTDSAPYGRIHKTWETDKSNVDQWVPLSEDARKAVDLLRQRNPVVGDLYLFPAPKKTEKPWSRWHARDLLERAERLAGVPKIKGGLWHPYRRKWATERKGHPDTDVAETGGWRDLRSLQTAYQQPDEETMLDVMSETRKLREAK